MVEKQTFSTHETHFKARSKKIIMLAMIFVVAILSVNLISAFEWDNVKQYDEETGKITIRNSILGIFPLGKVAEIYYPRVLKRFDIGEGDYQRIVEWDIVNYEDYPTFSKGVWILNNHLGEIIQKDYKLKYRAKVDEIQEPVYEITCDAKDRVILPNSSVQDNCKQTVKEYKTISKYEWIDIGDKLTTLPKGNITIGLYIDFINGESIDAIPEWYGYKLVEHVDWDAAGLNTGLSAYFSLNSTAVAFNSRNIDNKNATNSGATSIAGKLSTAYNCSGADFIELNGTGYPYLSGAAGRGTNAISMWIFPKETGGTDFAWQYVPETDTPDINLRIVAGKFDFRGFDDSTGGEDWRFVDESAFENTWQFIVMQWNSSSVEFWINGTRAASGTSGDLVTKEGVFAQRFCNRAVGTTGTFLGIMDEIGIWNGTVLTPEQIADLYNNGDGLGFRQTTLTATQNNPANDFSSTIPIVRFNCSGTGTDNVKNITMRLNNGSSFLVTGLDTTLSLERNLSLVDGNYSWNCTAFDTTHSSATTENRNLSVDTSPPSLTINVPTALLDYGFINKSENLSWTITEPNLNTVWFDYNGTNVTVFGLLNSTTFLVDRSEGNNITLYANDTAGNLNSTNRAWQYRVFDINLTYNNITLEGANERFIYNFRKASTLQVSSVDLIHNSTVYSFPYVVNGNVVTADSSITIPSRDSNANVTFFFNVTFTTSASVNTSLNNQTINVIDVDNCTSFSTLLYNFTMFNEETQEKLGTNTTAEVNMNLWDTAKTIVLVNFSQTFIDTNPFQICFNGALLTTVNYSSFVTVKYSANQTATNKTFSVEYYNILNQTIGNTTVPKNINLYDLESEDTTKFRLTFRDSSYDLAPNILVQIHREYIADNDFKVVEIPLTDSNGQTILNLVKNDVVYNLIMVDEGGQIVATFNSIRAFCQDFTIGECTINLNADPGAQAVFNRDNAFGIAITDPAFNNVTNLVSVIFVTTDLLPKTVRMDVSRNNPFGNRSVCSNSLTSASGTLACSVASITDTDQFLFVDIFINGVYYSKETINLNAADFGFGVVNGAFFAFLIILFLICLFMEDRRVLLVSLGLGWVLVIGLALMSGAFIGAGSVGIWILITIAMFLWKLNKEES